MKLKKTVLGAARRILSGEKGEAFTMRPSQRTEFPASTGTQDFYAHIPYCRNHCAYCPYNTKPLDLEEVPDFYEALLAEARLAAANGASVEGRSFYIGGGTPTCTGDGLTHFLREFTQICGQPATIALETSAEELTAPLLENLLQAGVTQLSVGVQSFAPHVLKTLGRAGHPETYAEKLEMAARAGFENLNVDLMYDADSESIGDLASDISQAIQTGADQLTIYPLFRFFRREGVAMPRLRNRRKFFAFVWKRMELDGFSPVSVWSFRKGRRGEAFSSVQRRTFVGLGPGAGTCREDLFAFNTFDTSAWMSRSREGKCAYSLEMPLSPNLSALYGLYWDLYAGHLPKKLDPDLKRRRLLALLASTARLLGFCRGETLTERGMYWIHLLQNQYMLDYIDRVWTISRETPYPEAVRL